MNISQMNSNSLQSFEGSIKMNKNYPRRFKKAFENNAEIQKLAERDYTIIPKLSQKKASIWDMDHLAGEDIYQLSITIKKEKPTFVEKLKYMAGKAPEVKVTESYHCITSLINLMSKRINAEKYEQKILK